MWKKYTYKLLNSIFYLFVLLLILMSPLAYASGPAYGQNILDNRDFENNLKDWHLGGTDPTAVIDKTHVYSGAKSCKVTPRYIDGKIYKTAVEQNNLPSIRGKYYYSEGYIKTLGTKENRAFLFFEFYDSAKPRNNVAPWVYIDLGAENTQNYKKHHGIFKAPKSGKLTRMGFKAVHWNTPGIIYFDNFKLRPINSTVTETLLEAESATYADGASIASVDNQTGGQCLKLDNPGAYVEWTINSKNQGEKTIAIRYYKSRNVKIKFNEIERRVRLSGANKFGTFVTVHMHHLFNRGDNVLRVTHNDSSESSVYIDNITIYDAGEITSTTDGKSLSKPKGLQIRVDPDNKTVR